MMLSSKCKNIENDGDEDDEEDGDGERRREMAQINELQPLVDWENVYRAREWFRLEVKSCAAVREIDHELTT